MSIYVERAVENYDFGRMLFSKVGSYFRVTHFGTTTFDFALSYVKYYI